MYKHTFYYFLGNKKYPGIYILLDVENKMFSSNVLNAINYKYVLHILVAFLFVT